MPWPGYVWELLWKLLWKPPVMLMHLMVVPAELQLAVLALLQSLLMPEMHLPGVACQKVKAMHLQPTWVQL